MRARLHRALMAGTASLALLGSCAYAPDFADDTLTCSATSTCPKGYTCAANNKCEKAGGAGSGLGGVGGGGTGGSAGGGDQRLDDFVGTWHFNSGTITGSCTDGSTINNQLTSAVFIIVTRGGAGLLLRYYCQDGWNMRLPLATNTALAIAGQTCRDSTVSGGVTTTYTWGAPTLTFTTSNGQTASISGHLAGPFSDSNGINGTCDIMFSGSLTKG
ncbi:MAG TPA: hypothetical protein VFH68_16435 [Polyangia bacterium]|jgi:hypothetical protein|nr:hypothetical protein [Polyangia bacterium]